MNTLIITVLVSQNFFAKTYGGPFDDRAYSLIQTSDGGYALAGFTESFGAGGSDCLVLKTDAVGNLVWAKTYGTTSPECAFSIIQTQDGGYALAGYAGSDSDPDAEYIMVLKLDVSGNILWERLFGGAGRDFASQIIQTPDEGYTVVGYTNSYGAGGMDILVMRLDASGNPLWVKTYGNANTDFAYSVTASDDGGYVITGFVENIGFGSTDLLVLKIDQSGIPSWGGIFGTNSLDEGVSVTRTSDNGYVVLGRIAVDHLAIIKLDASGNLIWTRYFQGVLSFLGGPGNIVQTSDGYVFATSTYTFYPIGGDEALLAKVDLLGNFLWARCFGGNHPELHDFFTRVIKTSEGYVMTGQTESFGEGLFDILILKTNHEGNYPNCVVPYSFSTLSGIQMSFRTFAGVDRAISGKDPNFTENPISPNAFDVCEVYVTTNESQDGYPRRIIVSNFSGGIAFATSTPLWVVIYSSDGRAVYSGTLSQGQTRIPLDQGVYLWQAGPYKGKAVVR